jgi:hypothetical protein
MCLNEKWRLAGVLITARTGDGRLRALAKGVRFGRKPKLTRYQIAEAVERRTAQDESLSASPSHSMSLAQQSGVEAAIPPANEPPSTNEP